MDRVKITEKLYIGPRYVFFNSLSQNQRPMYQRIYNQAITYLNGALDLLAKDDDGESEQRITAYINMIKNASEHALANEMKFFQVVSKRIDDIKNNTTLENEDMEQLRELIEGYNNNNNNTNFQFDYMKFLKLLQKIMLQNNNFTKEMVKRYGQDMKAYQSIFEESSPKLQQEIYDAYMKRGNAIAKLREALEKLPKEQHDKYDAEINSLLTDIYANAIQAIIGALNRDTKKQEALMQLFGNGKNKTKAEQYIVGYIVEYVLSQENLNDLQVQANEKDQKYARGKRLLEDFFDNIEKNIDSWKLSDAEIEDLLTAFSQRTINAIEYRALTNAKNIGRTFSNLSDEEKDKLFQRWGVTEEEQKLLQGFKDNKQYRKLTLRIKQIVLKYYDQLQSKGDSLAQKILDAHKLYKAADKEKRVDIRKDLAKALRPYRVKSSLMVGAKAEQSALAELILSHSDKILNTLFTSGNYVVSEHLGQLNIKTDNLINMCSQIILKNRFGNDAEEIFQILNESFVQFPRTYRESIGTFGSIDVETAAKTFLAGQLSARKKIIKKIKKSGGNVKKGIKDLSNFISTSISVKSYRAPMNRIGFHGGALGGSVTKTIENITKMYELGGISNIDKDLLIFAAYNCAEDLICGTGIIEDLETFLLGGAALMTFDEGFILLNKFLKQHARELIGTKVLLYNLNGVFIPASYVFSSIYQNLNEFYNGALITEKIQQTTNVTITNNINESYLLKPTKEKGDSTNTNQGRWDAMAEKADKAVKIEINFMAGLLDIYEQLTNFLTPQGP